MLNGITRRDFALAAGALAVKPGTAQSGPAAPALDIAEWSYFWVGVERAELARGTVVNGKQMYVEYQAPAQLKHPHPIVMVHGGGGQGLDWMGTPDGRRGWSTYFLEEGYAVYIVDRPGHGRSPFHPDLDGPFPRTAAAYENVQRQFAAPEKAEKPYGPQAQRHTQWPGSGEIGDPALDQVVAGQGGSFLASLEATHEVWRQVSAELLDKIGPAIIMTHSMGGPFGWIAADARPHLVKGVIGVEPNGPPFGNLRWGLTACRVAYEPPAQDPAEIKTVKVTPAEEGQDAYFIQAEPARRLVNLKGIPILLVTSEASYHAPYDAGSVAFLRQAGCTVEHIRLPERGIRGNAHFMMMEKNSREVLQPILDWAAQNITAKSKTKPAARARKSNPDSTAMKLADQGFFWVGTERKKMPYGTIQRGQMYVQYLIPAAVRRPYPVVLVHGGSGQMLHYMGAGGGLAGWAHYYVQEGYKVYLVDRPGHGRAPYHPDALGPINPAPVYAGIVADFQRATKGPHRRWMSAGDIGDPLVDQFMASQNATPQDNEMAQALWASRGAELLDKIGPAIVQTHSAGGPFGWLTAEKRPKLTKAIVCVEGGGMPQRPQNLAGIPIVYVTAEASGRTGGPALVAKLKQAGCDAEDLQLKDRGIAGNGHFMMIESNRREVFDVIRAWIEKKVPA
ncbi:MAG TPA: alpha/beta fold hydrolase [Bryobacteraceae bacterium]|nr:alpha/beta fold hydrolase [Bryobacteraceae bacterium]